MPLPAKKYEKVIRDVRRITDFSARLTRMRAEAATIVATETTPDGYTTGNRNTVFGQLNNVTGAGFTADMAKVQAFVTWFDANWNVATTVDDINHGEQI